MVLNFGWDHQSMSKEMGQNYYTEYTLLAQCFYLLKTELGEAIFFCKTWLGQIPAVHIHMFRRDCGERGREECQVTVSYHK